MYKSPLTAINMVFSNSIVKDDSDIYELDHIEFNTCNIIKDIDHEASTRFVSMPGEWKHTESIKFNGTITTTSNKTYKSVIHRDIALSTMLENQFISASTMSITIDENNIINLNFISHGDCTQVKIDDTEVNLYYNERINFTDSNLFYMMTTKVKSSGNKQMDNLYNIFDCITEAYEVTIIFDISRVNNTIEYNNQAIFDLSACALNCIENEDSTAKYWGEEIFSSSQCNTETIQEVNKITHASVYVQTTSRRITVGYSISIPKSNVQNTYILKIIAIAMPIFLLGNKDSLHSMLDAPDNIYTKIVVYEKHITGLTDIENIATFSIQNCITPMTIGLTLTNANNIDNINNIECFKTVQYDFMADDTPPKLLFISKSKPIVITPVQISDVDLLLNIEKTSDLNYPMDIWIKFTDPVTKYTKEIKCNNKQNIILVRLPYEVFQCDIKQRFFQIDYKVIPTQFIDKKNDCLCYVIDNENSGTYPIQCNMNFISSYNSTSFSNWNRIPCTTCIISPNPNCKKCCRYIPPKCVECCQAIDINAITFNLFCVIKKTHLRLEQKKLSSKRKANEAANNYAVIHKRCIKQYKSSILNTNAEINGYYTVTNINKNAMTKFQSIYFNAYGMFHMENNDII
jgi:hypothetical protein